MAGGAVEVARKKISLGTLKNCTFIDDSVDNVLQVEDTLGNILSLLKTPQSAISDISSTYYDIINSTGGTPDSNHELHGTDVADDLATLAAEYNRLENAVDSLVSTTNSILSALRAHGLIQT